MPNQRLLEPVFFRYPVEPTQNMKTYLSEHGEEYKRASGVISAELAVLEPSLGGMRILRRKPNEAHATGRVKNCILRKENNEYYLTGFAHEMTRPTRPHARGPKPPQTPIPSPHLRRGGKLWPTTRK